MEDDVNDWNREERDYLDEESRQACREEEKEWDE